MRLAFQTLLLLAVVVLVGGASVLALKKDLPDYPVPEGPWENSNLLDGMTFFTTDKVIETDDVVLDAQRFQDGVFQSAMCQVYCDFGWHPYQTFVEGDVIHFTVTTECPDAPHRVVFYGTVKDGYMTFEGTWTTRRWYWTHQVTVVGEGALTPTQAHLEASITE